MIDSVAVASRMAQAGEMLPLLVRHEIQVLLRAGHSQTDVAERVGVSFDSVPRRRPPGLRRSMGGLRLNVIADPAGNYMSGWRLGAEQLESVLTTGRLF